MQSMVVGLLVKAVAIRFMVVVSNSTVVPMEVVATYTFIAVEALKFFIEFNQVVSYT